MQRDKSVIFSHSTPSTTLILGGYYSEAHLAQELGVSVRTLKRWRSEGSGPSWVRIGRKLAASAEAVKKWLEAGGTK